MPLAGRDCESSTSQKSSKADVGRGDCSCGLGMRQTGDRRRNLGLTMIDGLLGMRVWRGDGTREAQASAGDGA